jgi:Holliday junction resolvase RusA-like endonuclease
MQRPGLPTEIFIVFDVEPTVKARPRVTRSGHTYTPAKTKVAENAISLLAKSAHKKPLEGPLKLKAIFYIQRPKKLKTTYPRGSGDLDNYLKLVSDALNGIFWVDDAQLVEIHVKKMYTEIGERPKIILSVESLPDA